MKPEVLNQLSALAAAGEDQRTSGALPTSEAPYRRLLSKMPSNSRKSCQNHNLEKQVWGPMRALSQSVRQSLIEEDAFNHIGTLDTV